MISCTNSFERPALRYKSIFAHDAENTTREKRHRHYRGFFSLERVTKLLACIDSETCHLFACTIPCRLSTSSGRNISHRSVTSRTKPITDPETVPSHSPGRSYNKWSTMKHKHLIPQMISHDAFLKLSADSWSIALAGLVDQISYSLGPC